MSHCVLSKISLLSWALALFFSLTAPGPERACAQLSSETPAHPSDSTGSNSTGEKPLSKKIDTHFGGRFKLSGRASKVDDDTYFEPVGTGTYWDGSFNFRLTNQTFFTDSFYTDAAYELIGSTGDSISKTRELKQLYPNLPANVVFGVAPQDDNRRLMDLTAVISEGDASFLFHRLDRLYLAWLPAWGSVRVGRQAITWGDGFVFNPFDLFNPFPPTAIDRDYKTGDDMVNAQFAIPGVGDLQGLYVVRREIDTGEVNSNQASLAGKLHFTAGKAEFDLLGSRHYQDYVAGIGSTGYLKDAAWRINGTWTFLKDGDDYLSLAANMDYAWNWLEKNFYGFIEYYFNGLGQTDYQDALLDPCIQQRLARGELFVLGRNYLSGHLQVELTPLFNVFFTAINNVQDPSGILQLYATWDIIQSLQLTGGVNIPYGTKGTEYGGFTLPGTDIHTKSPDNAYLWLIYYF